MRFAINIPPFAEADALVEMAVEAEQAGWDTVMVWDHLQWIASLELDVHDPWGLLSAMAVRTERVRLGTCATPLSRRRTQVVARHPEHTAADYAEVGVTCLVEGGVADGRRGRRVPVQDRGWTALALSTSTPTRCGCWTGRVGGCRRPRRSRCTPCRTSSSSARRPGWTRPGPSSNAA